MTDWLGEAPIEDIERGYMYDAESGMYRCLICGSSSERGVIYASAEDGVWWDAEKWMREHIAKQHGSVFHALLHLDKKWTGLSALQKQLLLLFHEGMSDAEVLERVGGGSASTIRNHRFTLREKEKQAKLFLVLMRLMEKGKAAASASGKGKKRGRPASVQPIQDLLELEHDYFPEGLDGPLKEWPRKERARELVAEELTRRFQPDVPYAEAEVNGILEQAWPDYAVIRRFMVDYGWLERTEDGRAYWLGSRVKAQLTVLTASSVPEVSEGGEQMEKQRRKELVTAYEEMEKPIGVFRFVNKQNGKTLVGSTRNLNAMERRLPFELKLGTSQHKELIREWNEYGEDSFEFEVLETLRIRKEGFQDIPYELEKLEEKWLNDLQPYGERGYNKLKPARKVDEDEARS